LRFLLSILLAALALGSCYVDVYELGNSSASQNDSSSDSSHKSSSSYDVVLLKDSLIYQGDAIATIKIGSQIWLAKNFNAEPSKGNWWCSGDNYCNDKKPEELCRNTEYCKLYGKLYDWEAAMNVCPDGWKLPSKDDWKSLSDRLSDRMNILESESWWNAAFGGYRDEKNAALYIQMRKEGRWWSSTDAGNGSAYYSNLMKGGELKYVSSETKTMGYSVRCIKK